MKAKPALFSFCLILLVALADPAVFAEKYVASVNGTLYTDLKASFDAAKLAEGDAGKTVTLLADVDFQDTTLVLDGGGVILNLNGRAVTSAAEKTLLLTGGASLPILDEPGGGLLQNTAKGGKTKSAVIYIEDGESSLTVNGGPFNRPIMAARPCTARKNPLGGNVDSVSHSDGTTAVYNQYHEQVFKYVLIIGVPPVQNVKVGLFPPRLPLPIPIAAQ